MKMDFGESTVAFVGILIMDWIFYTVIAGLIQEYQQMQICEVKCRPNTVAFVTDNECACNLTRIYKDSK